MGIEGISKKINNSTTKTILLVDDFIGTGETALSCIEEYNEKGIVIKN